ncbi:hypothetical protein IKF26_00825 [Candidatus Saccharibacteria bacterium]|nr:hypothetical protein [Candidatus Saccharibacteria bacterium]
MGVIVNKENIKNDELSKRINADLRTKMSGGVGVIDGETPDLVDDSEYMQNFKKTSKFGWVWVVLIVLAILSLLAIIFF